MSLAFRSAAFRIILLALSSAEVARRGGALDTATHQVSGWVDGLMNEKRCVQPPTHPPTQPTQVALQLFLLPSSVLFDSLAVTGQVLVADSLGRHAKSKVPTHPPTHPPIYPPTSLTIFLPPPPTS